MNLKFGLGLDGFEGAAPVGELGSLTCGPLGLLDALELRLGLKAKPARPLRRILQFRELLEEMAGKRPVFYASSLVKDPLAVASTLLGWRDQLIEAGWDGRATAQDSPRLQVLAALEAEAASRLASGLPDRLRAVLQALASRSAGVQSLAVLENRNHLPALWAGLCDRLGAVYQPAPDWQPHEAAGPATDLGSVQAILRTASPGAPKKLRLRHDGSLVCLTAHSEITLAGAMAQWLADARQRGTTTLLAGDDAGVIERALIAQDDPALGLAPRSRARPIPQVLLLALRLRWDPLDPRALLEFLTHPVCPVTSLLRGRLAKAVAASPGIGGPAWLRAVESARQDARERSDATAQAQALRRIDEDLAQWLLCARFNPGEGAPGKVLSECCAQVARWAGSRGGATEPDAASREQFLALAAAASDLADWLRTQPSVKRAQLENVLREETSGGWAGCDVPAELGHVHRVAGPGALVEPADTVVWWDFSEPPSLPRLPWTEAELGQLEAHGARLISPQVRALHASSTWLRPVLAARKRLVLATPRQQAGDAVARHPLYSRLLGLCEGSPATLPTRDLDDELASRRAAEPVSFTALSHRPLPPLRRWWKLPARVRVGERGRESYSSLEKFIYSPYAWVLRYKARLQAGPVSSMRLAQESTLRGTLLHRLLDLVLAAPAAELEWRTAAQSQLDVWLERRWPMLLEQEGANLLLPGSVADGAGLLQSGKAALWELFQQMRAARVTTARSNIDLGPTPFLGGQLEGTVDLLTENHSGQTGVVDLKFGGRDLREKELAENRQLQLAVYGYLLRQRDDPWPEAAFFILTSRRMMAQANGYFPNARVVRPAAVPGLASCWTDFEQVWRWRRRQLDVGWIEVTASGTDPEDQPSGVPDALPPLPHWQATEDQSKYNDFDALTGWSIDS